MTVRVSLLPTGDLMRQWKMGGCLFVLEDDDICDDGGGGGGNFSINHLEPLVFTQRWKGEGAITDHE
ncbi:hypothetical protein EJB05_50587, partial [Eragrostis curvula]